MRYFHIILGSLLLLIITAACESLDEVSSNLPTCSVVVRNALDATDRICDGTGRNQACYGHVLVKAEPQAGIPSFKFDQEGDLVDVAAIKSLRLSPMSADEEAWGVTLMRLQANLPDTAPGENVTVLLFGDVEIRNAIPAPRSLSVTVATNGNLNVRLEPAEESFVMGTLASGTAVTARGRSEDGSWLYIDLPDGERHGWIGARFVTTEGDIHTLNPVEPYLAQAAPMQAFYLRTGDNASHCAEAPNDGILIQTPEGVAEVRLWINEVKIRLGSTVFVQASPKQKMTISTLEGSAHVEAFGVEQVATAGNAVSVPMNENMVAAAPPSPPQPIKPPAMQNLPVNNLDVVVTPLIINTSIAPTPVVTDTAIPTVRPADTATATVAPTNTATDIPTATATTINLPTDTETPTDVPATDVPLVTATDTDLPLAARDTLVPGSLPTDVPTATTEVAERAVPTIESTPDNVSTPAESPATTSEP